MGFGISAPGKPKGKTPHFRKSRNPGTRNPDALYGRKEESRKGLDRPSEETRGERPEFGQISERIWTVGSKPPRIVGSRTRTRVSEFGVCRGKGTSVRCFLESRKSKAQADRWHIPDVGATWMKSGLLSKVEQLQTSGILR
jgi:hypothetical protein